MSSQPTSSQYQALADFLSAAAPNATVTLTFKQVEQIIHADLPETATKHYQQWWANDATHVQAQPWLDAGWSRQTIDVSTKTVTFVKASTDH